MKRYIEQLSADIDRAYSLLQDKMLNDPYEDVMDEGEYVQTKIHTTETLKLNHVTGINKNDLPPTHLLSPKQRTYLGKKLEALLWVCNFIITVPIIFTSAQRYSFIREIWNNGYKLNKGGLCIVKFYTYHKFNPEPKKMA